MILGVTIIINTVTIHGEIIITTTGGTTAGSTVVGPITEDLALVESDDGSTFRFALI